MIAEIVGLPAYESQVSTLLDEEEQLALEFFIACAPEDHPVIPGSGGFRKARWARHGKGRAMIMGVRNSKLASKKRTKFGLELEQSARQILSHVKEDLKLRTRRIVLPDDVDVKRIRTKAGMSQAEFARAFCINPRTLQEWEQGRRKPDATTRAYLAVIAKNRKAVLAALAS